MRELTVLRRARPDVAPPDADERAVARAQLLAAIERAEAATGVAGPARDLDDRRLEDRPDGAGEPRRPSPWTVRWRPVAVLVAALAVVATIVVALEQLLRLEVAPVITDLEDGIGELDAPAELGTYAVATSTVPLWDGEIVPLHATAPDDPGPWPQVIVLPHESAAESPVDTPIRHVEAMLPVAEALSSTGLVVWTLAWEDYRRGPDSLVNSERIQACAVAYAREHGPAFGGDPDRVTVFGQGLYSFVVVEGVVTGVAPVDGCAASGDHRPDLVAVATPRLLLPPRLARFWSLEPEEHAANVAMLEARTLPDQLVTGHDVPFVVITSPLAGGTPRGELRGRGPEFVRMADPASARAVVDAMRLAGYRVAALEVEGLGSTAFTVGHPPTWQALWEVAVRAYAPRP